MGWVGSSTAISLLHTGAIDQLYINDIRDGVAEGEAMDLSHGSSFYPQAKVRACSVEDMRECDIVIITAGRGGKSDETRLQLLKDNAKIIEDIANKLGDFKGIVVMLSNPVDVLTHVFQEASGLPAERVLGTGTMLDTARLRDMIGHELNIEPKSVHTQVIGEHGDSEVVLWSSARIGSKKLRDWQGWNSSIEPKIADQVKHAAYEIIKRKGATNHAIGLVTAHLVKWILRDERRIICLTRYHDEYGTAISLPAIVGIEGAKEIIFPELSEVEQSAFENSVNVLRDAYASLKK